MDSAGNIRERGAGLGALAILLVASGASAEVKISNVATKNMSCAAGVCAPTSNHAVLNAGALQAMLASGDVEVTTLGAGAQAKDIVVDSALTWASTHALTLDAFQSIMVDNPVSITGRSALTLTTNDGGAGGELSFGTQGSVTFANLGSSLTINGVAYALVGTVQGLAAAVAANQSGDFALANNYDAKPDGVYGNAPIATQFLGNFEGLGNRISNLQVRVTATGAKASLFYFLVWGGQIHDLGVENVQLSSAGSAGGPDVGGLAGQSGGDIEHCFATGTAHSFGKSFMGGLIAVNTGTVRRSWAAVKATGAVVGGLIGFNEAGTVSESFAQGSVTSPHRGARGGGLVGWNEAAIVDSYATSSVTGPYDSSVEAPGGGLVGQNLGNAKIATSYSTGFVSGFFSQGGLIGADYRPAGSLSDTYWDTTTSGFPGPGQGAGTPANDPGITGLTTAQLQSGLPAGFSRSTWGQNPSINGGLPYLLNNPPP